MDRTQALKIAAAARKAMVGYEGYGAADLAAEVEMRMTNVGAEWRADAFDNLTAAEFCSDERLADRIMRAGR